MKKILTISLIVLAFSLSAFTQDMKDKGMMDKENMKPIVAVISADWCPYCKNVEPVMMKLMKDYGEKFNFVVFDVTSDETSKASMMKAEKLGLSDFFKENKRKTSAVAVLKDKKVVYKTFNNTKREDYEMAFEKALK